MVRIACAEDIGSIVRAERRRQGLSQRELAEYAGASIMFISALERGKPTARFDKLLDVLQTLSIDLFAIRR